MEASLRNQVDLNLINLGCGYLARPHWKNFDLNPQLPYVQKWRLGQQVMLAAGAADAIYHSHFMEHLSYPEAVNLLRECARLVRPGGIIRVVVPDHEYNSRLYLDALLDVLELDSPENRERYEWATLNMFDQMVRVKSGGQMAPYWSRPDLVAWSYVVETTGGVEADDARKQMLGFDEQPFVKKLRASLTDPRRLVLSARLRILGLARRIIYGRFTSLMQPIVNGELHRWAWDRYSLRKVLLENGFTNVEFLDACTSRIPGFADDCLDTDETGKARKPHSLYVEAVRLRG